jgi:type IV pilus assembly protein PilY1
MSSLTGILTATDTTATDPNYGCYLYNGWLYALRAGVMPTSANGVPASQAQPSERVISSQVLFEQILLTPTYIPPGAAAIAAANSSVCNPIPVPGTSNLYGMNYLTGTSDIGMLAGFGSSGGKVLTVVSLGSGLASSPVLHTGGGNVTAAFGLSGGTTLQSVSGMKGQTDAEISWREPVTNQ